MKERKNAEYFAKEGWAFYSTVTKLSFQLGLGIGNSYMSIRIKFFANGANCMLKAYISLSGHSIHNMMYCVL